MKSFKDYLESISACSTAVAWVKNKDLCAAWRTCKRPDWLLWLAARTSVDRRLIARAMLGIMDPDIKCIEPVHIRKAAQKTFDAIKRYAAPGSKTSVVAISRHNDELRSLFWTADHGLSYILGRIIDACHVIEFIDQNNPEKAACYAACVVDDVLTKRNAKAECARRVGVIRSIIPAETVLKAMEKLDPSFTRTKRT